MTKEKRIEETNVVSLDAAREFTSMGRSILIAILITQRARIAALETEVGRLGGITLRGWRCGTCQSFNGEEHSPRTECRSCGVGKHTVVNPGNDPQFTKDPDLDELP